jgi:aspartyl/asparaginyl-tRNA synthetase
MMAASDICCASFILHYAKHCTCRLSLLLQVLLRARLHAVRGKGKSCFLVLRQRTATIQVCVLCVMQSSHTPCAARALLQQCKPL